MAARVSDTIAVMVCPHCAATIQSSDYSCPTCKTDLRPPPMDGDLRPQGWSWNPLLGVMYGSVPVGLIVGLGGLAIFGLVYMVR